MPQTTELDFFKKLRGFSDPGRHRALLGEFPAELPEICRWIQGLFIHPIEAKKVYGVELPHSLAWREENIHTVEHLFDLLLQKDPRPIRFARDAENRVAVICRTYSIFLAVVLRARGIPARARAGTATYFTPGKFEDHWICEWWSAAEHRWIRTDAQIDAAQRADLGIKFDTLDLPAGAFLVAGEAWFAVEAGEISAKNCGILEYWGKDWLRAQLFRDIEALVGREPLPWEEWGIGDSEDPGMDRFSKILDEMAKISTAGSHAAATKLVGANPRLFRGKPTVGAGAG